MSDYTIVEAQLPLIFGLAGHDLLVMKDPNGNVIGEIDGLATSSSGAVKAIGWLPSDTLKVYSYSSAQYYSNSEAQAVVASGSQATIQNMWNAALQCKADINSENLPYPFLGLGANSNSVASTLDACMGAAEPTIQGSALITPGVGTLVLPKATIAAVQQIFGVAPVDINGDSAFSNMSGATVVSSNPDGSVSSASFWVDTSGNGHSDLTDYNPSNGVDWEQSNTLTSSGGVTTDLYGSGEAVTLATGSLTTVYASGDSIMMDGDSEWSGCYGYSDTTYMYGNYDTSVSYNASNTTYAYGYGDYFYYDFVS